MSRAPGGYLPYDSGDNSHRNLNKSPFSSRGFVRKIQAQTDSYLGKNSGEATYYTQLETRQSYSHNVSLLGRSAGNIGGNFVHTKTTVDKFGDYLEPYTTGSTWRSAGGIFTPGNGMFTNLGFDPKGKTYSQIQSNVEASGAPLVSRSEMDAWGTTAIARVAPTNPLVDLSTSAAELLREGLPSLPGNAGNLGGEYLNIMFGYLPLVGDAQGLTNTARNHDALLRQFERDSGRRIRRRYEFPPDTSISENIVRTGIVPGLLGLSPSGLVTTGRHVRTKVFERKVWFEGAFTYHLPQTGWRRTAAELDHLYGVKPGTDTLWELMPYSWLVDYFTNVGDVMKNITAFTQDGLVMPYGYLMCEQKVEHEETWTGPMRFGAWRDTTISAKITHVTQQRRLANPFGFGVESGGLSGRQVSILAALGISRM